MTNTKKTYPSRKIKGFTLIELIIVITILAILSTIGFLSIWGYSSKARDSSRVSDLAMIAESLDLSEISAGSYPDPDNFFSVTYTGSSIWKQGKVGTSVLSFFKSTMRGGWINTIPTDPLNKSEYIYSSLTNGKAYQILASYEKNVEYSHIDAFTETAYAASERPNIAYVRGNYFGLISKVSIGNSICVITVPSLLVSMGVGTTGYIEIGTLTGAVIFHWHETSGTQGFVPGFPVHCGDSLPSTPESLEAMVTKLQSAYSGFSIPPTPSIADLLSATGSESLISLGSNLVKVQLGGNAAMKKNTGQNTIHWSGTPWDPWNSLDWTTFESCQAYNLSLSTMTDGSPRWSGNCGNGVQACLTSGIYLVGQNGIPVYCDMLTNGGWWSLIFHGTSSDNTHAIMLNDVIATNPIKTYSSLTSTYPVLLNGSSLIYSKLLFKGGNSTWRNKIWDWVSFNAPVKNTDGYVSTTYSWALSSIWVTSLYHPQIWWGVSQVDANIQPLAIWDAQWGSTICWWANIPADPNCPQFMDIHNVYAWHYDITNERELYVK